MERRHLDTFPPASEPPAKPPIFPVGTVLSGTYEIRSVLGEGGMGQVFEAYDTLLGRRVAIKAHWPSTIYSIRHEARALAPLRHPAIVTVHALGIHQGVEYAVMEFVAGNPWSDRLEELRARGERIPVLEALDVLERVADGLTAVHGAGIAHGDVKPSNVLLAPGRAILTDLGLVRIEANPHLAKMISGTPTYLAPEVVSGEVKPGCSHLVDVYAFGVMAYEALAGVRPYVAEHYIFLFSMHQNDPIPRLADAITAPPGLSDLVVHAMAKDPLERPSMDVIHHRLQAINTALKAKERSLEVLIVDDDIDLARLIAFSVKEGCKSANVEIASSGREALESVRRREPALILLDLMMPGMTGFEVFAYMRGAGLTERCRVIAVSAATPDDDVSLLLGLGVRAFVQKGADMRKQVRELSRTIAAERGLV